MIDSNIGPVDLLIFQPTPFCNLDCKYCYLPERNSKDKMDLNVIKITLEKLVDEKLLGDSLNLLWHAGEPTVMPIDYYEKVELLIEEIIPKEVKVIHQIQTNATLLNDEWCEFFKKSNMLVGVSLDGPKHINDKNRVLRNGKGTFDQVMNGIMLLKKHNIDFSIISVLTDYSLDFPDEIYNFFIDLGVTTVGFNMDEEEGINTKSSISDSSKNKLKLFWARIFELQTNLKNHLSIREIYEFNSTLFNADLNIKSFLNRGQMLHPLSILTIDTEGNFSTFSPELLGMKDEKYKNFHFGNVIRNSISSISSNSEFSNVYNDIISGVKKCFDSCEYFSFCGGGAPSNKLYENGSFDSTETNFCKFSKKVLVDVFLDKIESEIN